MDHDRAFAYVVRRRVRELEVLGLGEVELDRRELPSPPDGILDVNIDLRTVEGSFSVGHLIGQPCGLERLGKGSLGDLPELVGSDRLLRISRREVGFELVESEVPQNHQNEVEKALQLVRHLVERCEDVTVVLGEPASSQEAVHDTGPLVAVDGPQFEEAQWQLPVASTPRLVDEDVERAVHRLHVVLLAPVELHRRVHALCVELEMATRLPQVRLGDMGRYDALVSVREMCSPAVVLDLLAEQATLGMPDRQPAPEIGWERVQIEFGAKLPVIALRRLFEAMQVLAKRLAVFPCGPVDALELGLVLVAAPVGAGRTHQLHRFETTG